jgi:GrpB-like predicted nucleotidyltransferase (UPF0157 family)
MVQWLGYGAVRPAVDLLQVHRFADGLDLPDCSRSRKYILGQAAMKWNPNEVILQGHCPVWADRFANEANRLRAALGANVLGMHHIGSTAIPGICAKPIIDILIEVESLERLDACDREMVSLGYEVMGEYGLPGRRHFRRYESDRVGGVHVHSYELGHPDLVRHVAFRDYMCAHLDEAEAYSALKLQLSAEFPKDRDSYANGQSSFIQERQRRALNWRGFSDT